MNGKSKALTLFSAIAIAAIVSGIIIIPQLVNAVDEGDTALTTQISDPTETSTQETNETILPAWGNECMGFGRHGTQFGMRDFGGFGTIQVSDEFKQTATGIAENDTDVQNLINDGYNFTSVKPIIQTVINGDGTLVTKATSAILTLQKDTTGHATVMVNIEEAKVTQIVILTRTVIDKP